MIGVVGKVGRGFESAHKVHGRENWRGFPHLRRRSLSFQKASVPPLEIKVMRY
jgi:hypothetical protein